MFEKILNWPSPIDRSNWQQAEPVDLLEAATSPISMQLESFSRVLALIKAGLEAVEDPSIFSRWNFKLAREEHLDIWATLLNSIKVTAQRHPDWLNNGAWAFNEDQVAAWSPQFSNIYGGGIAIGGDGHLLTTVERQYDFGTLYDIGHELERQTQLSQGGVGSTSTQAAKRLIEQTAAEARTSISTQSSDAETKIAETAKSSIAQIETFRASQSWSKHYRARCEELTEMIDGKKLNKIWGKIPNRQLGLKANRSVWYVILMIALAAYAAVALSLMTGWGPLHLKSSLDSVLQGFGKYFIALTFYGLLGGVYLGYSYANRQLKIYQNLREQYRHRSIVAETIEGIVAAVIKTKENTAIPEEKSSLRDEELEQLVKIAANTMFEYRPIGHLSTKEGGGFLGDILNFKG